MGPPLVTRQVSNLLVVHFIGRLSLETKPRPRSWPTLSIVWRQLKEYTKQLNWTEMSVQLRCTDCPKWTDWQLSSFREVYKASSVHFVRSIRAFSTWWWPGCGLCCCCWWWLIREAATGGCSCWPRDLAGAPGGPAGLLSAGKNAGWAWYRGFGVRRPSPSCNCWKFLRSVDSPGISVTALTHQPINQSINQSIHPSLNQSSQ